MSRGEREPIRVAVVGDAHRAAIERSLPSRGDGTFSVTWARDAETLRCHGLFPECAILATREPAAARAWIRALQDADTALILVDEGDERVEARVYAALAAGDLSPRLLRRTIEQAVAHQRTEALLRHSERRLAEAQRVAGLGSWEWDVARNRITWSEELHGLYGVPPGQVEAGILGPREQMHPDARTPAERTVQQALETGGRYSYEQRIVGPHGEVRWLHNRGEVVIDAEGRLLSMRGTVQDVTERVEGEAARRESHERFRSIFQSSLDAMLIADDERRYVAANPAACELLGLSAAEICRKRIDDVTVPELREALAETWPTFLHENKLPAEWSLLGCGGRVVLVEISATANIGPGRHLAIMRDITERKRTEQELQRRLGQQAAVAALGGRALSRAGLSSLMHEAASALAVHLDVSYTGVLELQPDNETLAIRAGRGWADGVVGSRQVSADRRSQAGYTLRVGEPVILEDLETEQRFQGSALLREHGVVSGLSVVIEGPGRPFGVLSAHSGEHRVFTRDDVSFMQSVANILSAAVELHRAQALQHRLHQTQRLESVGQLAGGIAHDFNNLLAVILNYAGFAIEELADRPDVRADVEEVKRAAERGAELTQQLLVFSRRDVVTPELVDVNASVSAAENLLRRTLEEHISLETSLEPELCAVRVGAGQVEQVLLNLALNARDAMTDGGTLMIETRSVRLAGADERRLPLGPGRYVVISVRDTGMGMPKEVRDRACEPFFTTKQRGAGTGLGLPTINGIVAEAGGGMLIDSEPGEGTTVTIYLPAADGSADAKEGADGGGTLPGRGEPVLVVEDEDSVRALTERILSANGYRVIAVETGDEALAVCRHEHVALLLTDVVMPGMSGQELATRARELQPDLLVLFMSGYADEVISRSRLERERIPLLQKPFSSLDLLKSVRQALSHPAGTAGRSGPATLSAARAQRTGTS